MSADTKTTADSKTTAWKKLFEITGYLSTALGLIKGFKDFSGAKSIDGFLEHIGNTAAAVIAVVVLMAGLGIWLSALLGMGELINRVPTPLLVIICGLVGIYWSYQKGYSVERPYSTGLGAIIVIATVYLVYKRLTDQKKET